MERDSNCIFCKIINKEIPGKFALEKDEYVALYDINPQAPTHALIIPRQHVRNITEFKDAASLGKLFQAANELVEMHKLQDGFRLVVNTGDSGGQTVDHLHIHLLGGRGLSWPPG
ncbi:MAG: histidine triad nucleotide-binding protein [Candidatus Obscuribacterales bacterium]